MVAKRWIDISRWREIAFIGMHCYFFLFTQLEEPLNILKICRVPSFGLDMSIFFELLNIHLVTQSFNLISETCFLPIQNFLENMKLLDQNRIPVHTSTYFLQPIYKRTLALSFCCARQHTIEKILYNVQGTKHADYIHTSYVCINCNYARRVG